MLSALLFVTIFINDRVPVTREAKQVSSTVTVSTCEPDGEGGLTCFVPDPNCKPLQPCE